MLEAGGPSAKTVMDFSYGFQSTAAGALRSVTFSEVEVLQGAFSWLAQELTLKKKCFKYTHKQIPALATQNNHSRCHYATFDLVQLVRFCRSGN